jgi:hypothetical protein
MNFPLANRMCHWIAGSCVHMRWVRMAECKCRLQFRPFLPAIAQPMRERENTKGANLRSRGKVKRFGARGRAKEVRELEKGARMFIDLKSLGHHD